MRNASRYISIFAVAVMILMAGSSAIAQNTMLDEMKANCGAGLIHGYEWYTLAPGQDLEIHWYGDDANEAVDVFTGNGNIVVRVVDHQTAEISQYGNIKPSRMIGEGFALMIMEWMGEQKDAVYFGCGNFFELRLDEAPYDEVSAQ